jgi:Restriction endonuclease S subunits
MSAIRSFALPDLPSLPTQHAIARILGSLDDKIELNRQMNETLEAMARAIFQSWFVDFDPVRAKAEGRRPAGMDAETAGLFPSEFEEVDGRVVPKGWKLGTMGESTTVVGGSTPSTTNAVFWENGTHLFTTPKDLAGLSIPILMNTEQKITDLGVDQISSKILPVGTVLLSSRAPIGYVAFTAVPVSINQGFIAIICDKDLPKYYVLSWVKENLPLIIDRANGTTFLEISKSNFKPMQVLIPSIKVLKKFVQQVKPLYDQIENNEQQSRTLAQLRDALLPKLMSGEISVDAKT